MSTWVLIGAWPGGCFHTFYLALLDQASLMKMIMCVHGEFARGLWVITALSLKLCLHTLPSQFKFCTFGSVAAMLHKLLISSPFLLCFSEADIPRGLVFNYTEEEMAQANSLLKQFEAESKMGIYVGIPNIRNAMKNCNQQCSNWCWDASATMAASAFVDVGDCNAAEEKIASSIFQTTCTGCSGDCNHGGSTTDMANGVELLSGQKYVHAIGPISEADFDKALQIGPIILGYQWSTGGGHAIAIGQKVDGRFVGHDPENYAIEASSYAELLGYSPVYCQWPCYGTWRGTASPSLSNISIAV